MKLQEVSRNLTTKSLYGRLVFIDFDAANDPNFDRQVFFSYNEKSLFKMKKNTFLNITLLPYVN